MKNKLLIMLAVIVLYIVSWFTVGQSAIGVPKQYDKYIASAREKSDLKIYVGAIKDYKEALKIKNDDINVHFELARQFLNMKDERMYIQYCNDLTNIFLKNDKPFIELAKYYLSTENYVNCFKTINMAKNRSIQSKELEDIEKTISYKYQSIYNSYKDVKVFNEGLCPVSNGKKLGYVNSTGKVVISFHYDDALPYSLNLAAVMLANEVFYINKDGDRELATKESLKSLGLFSDNLTPTSKDGKYYYVNMELKKVFGDYDFASNFSNDVSAVKKGDKWALLGIDGKEKTGFDFEDIKLDEKGRCFRNGVAFVKQGGKYFLVDISGKKISEALYDDVVVFSLGEPTAVKVGNAWGFVDIKGKMIIEPEYQEAKSFSNGLAAVKVNGQWGYITPDKKLVIDAIFTDAKDFNDKGSAFVKTGDQWKLIRLCKFMD